MRPINWKRVWKKFDRWEVCYFENHGHPLLEGDRRAKLQRLVKAELRMKAKKGKGK